MATIKGVRIGAVALPSEHGGWGFCLEPVVLGLLVAPSLAGFLIAVAAILLFLTRQPMKLVATDVRRGKFYPRTSVAFAFMAIYGLPALLLGFAAYRIAGENWVLPLLFALPLFGYQIAWDLRTSSRALLPELIGPVAMASAASAIAIAGGCDRATAYALWAVLAARAVPAVLYVRSRIRLERGGDVSRTWVTVAHVAAMVLLIALLAVRVVPAIALLVFALLLVRCEWGLSPFRHSARPSAIGISELVFGAVTVLVVAAGYHWSF